MDEKTTENVRAYLVARRRKLTDLIDHAHGMASASMDAEERELRGLLNDLPVVSPERRAADLIADAMFEAFDIDRDEIPLASNLAHEIIVDHFGATEDGVASAGGRQ